MSLLGPAFRDASLDPQPVTAQPGRGFHRYQPPTVPAPAALDSVTEALDELLDAKPTEVAPYADDLSEAFELLRNVADKIADDRAERSAA